MFERDHGICSACGYDVGKLERVIEWASRHQWEMMLWRRPDRRHLFIRITMATYLLKGMEGNWTWQGDTLWQPDHILPVVDGGGMCGLSNYRTLCSPCHLAVTTVGRRRLAKSKRLGKKTEKHRVAMLLKWAVE